MRIPVSEFCYIVSVYYDLHSHSNSMSCLNILIRGVRYLLLSSYNCLTYIHNNKTILIRTVMVRKWKYYIHRVKVYICVISGDYCVQRTITLTIPLLCYLKSLSAMSMRTCQLSKPINLLCPLPILCSYSSIM